MPTTRIFVRDNEGKFASAGGIATRSLKRIRAQEFRDKQRPQHVALPKLRLGSTGHRFIKKMYR